MRQFRRLSLQISTAVLHFHDVPFVKCDNAVCRKELTEEAAKKAAAALEPEKKGKDKKK